MGAKRAREIWSGKGGDAQKRGRPDENPWLHRPVGECWDEAARIDNERMLCQTDFMYLYDNYLARMVRDRKTKEIKKQSLGKIHKLMLDFLTMERWDDVRTHSTLPAFAPEKDANGDYPETWIYYKTLDAPPTVCTGNDNPIANMFYSGDTIWQGVTIRLCGDGFTKCVLAPRGHLKSHIAGMYQTLWRMIQFPEERNVIRSVTDGRAKTFLDAIKYHFEQNAAFIDIFGHLKPDKREAAWNTEMIQLICANRRGPDKTVVSSGMESDGTGSHADAYVNDDIAGESNTLTAMLRAKARGVIEKQQDQCDPGANLTDIGTRWEEDDPHVLFVGKPGDSSQSGSMAEFTSFFVATVLDGDETVKISTHLSPLGYGKLIWPEHWTMATLARKRAGKTDDRGYFGQYFNQFAGTTNRLFSKAMIRRFAVVDKRGRPCSMLEFARENELDITIGADTASGLPTASEKAKRDDTAACVLGQTKDRSRIYVLDGLCEKLPVEGIATGLLDLAMKWHANCKLYNGNFRVGFEKTKWEKILSPILSAEQRKRGMDAVFGMELLSHGSIPKVERIRVLVPDYRDGRILWPETLIVTSVPIIQADGSTKQAEPYDFCQRLEAEFTAYNPYATVDNILDAQAYAYKMTLPTEWKPEPVKNTPVLHPGEYARSATRGPVPQPTCFDHDEHMERAY